MNRDQAQAAATIAQIVERSSTPLRRLGFNPLTTEWDWQGGRRAEEPMANLRFDGLKQLLEGRYHVYLSGGVRGDDVIEVDYYHPNGTTYRCFNKNGANEQTTMQWYSAQTAMGFAGVLSLDIPASQRQGKKSSNYGWPTIYDPATGDLVSYGIYPDPNGGKSWQADIGHVQTEYAPVFAEICPNLPRVDAVNQGQTSADYDTFRSQAPSAPVRMNGITVFNNDWRDPLTAEMYYSAYPPRQ